MNGKIFPEYSIYVKSFGARLILRCEPFLDPGGSDTIDPPWPFDLRGLPVNNIGCRRPAFVPIYRAMPAGPEVDRVAVSN